MPLLIYLILLIDTYSSTPSECSRIRQSAANSHTPTSMTQGTRRKKAFGRFFPSGRNSFGIVPCRRGGKFTRCGLRQNSRALTVLDVDSAADLPATTTGCGSTARGVTNCPVIGRNDANAKLLIGNHCRIGILSHSPDFARTSQIA